MKDFQMIIEFRRAHKRLNYTKSKWTIGDLQNWIIDWCNEKQIPNDMFNSFIRLGFAYAEKDFNEAEIYRFCKKQRLSK